MWTKTIQSVAEQLCIILKDYDVSYEVARYYVQRRVEDSTEECRRYHFDCLTLKQMPKEMTESKRTIILRYCATDVLDEVGETLPFFDLGLEQPPHRRPEAEFGRPYKRAIWGPITNEKKNTFSAMIRFMSSERGVRTPYWRVYASAWGIPDLDKEKITIRDKLNDMKKITPRIVEKVGAGGDLELL